MSDLIARLGDVIQKLQGQPDATDCLTVIEATDRIAELEHRHKRDLAEYNRVAKRIAELEERLLLGVFLPKITDEIRITHELLIEDGQWSQDAVDFAALLNSTLRQSHPAMIQEQEDE